MRERKTRSRSNSQSLRARVRLCFLSAAFAFCLCRAQAFGFRSRRHTASTPVHVGSHSYIPGPSLASLDPPRLRQMPPAPSLSRALRAHALARAHRPPSGAGAARRPYSSAGQPPNATRPPPPPPGAKQPSRHAVFYQDMVPGMLSVGLLGSAVYLVRSTDPSLHLCSNVSLGNTTSSFLLHDSASPRSRLLLLLPYFRTNSIPRTTPPANPIHALPCLGLNTTERTNVRTCRAFATFAPP